MSKQILKQTSQKKPIKIILFYADWCHFCEEFIPLWNKMKEDTEATKNIDFEQYEEKNIDQLPDNVKLIDDIDVRALGYPSIKIIINNKDYIYDGKRTDEKIYEFIYDILVKNKGLASDQSEILNENNNIKRRINKTDFADLFRNTNLLKPFKIE